MILTLHRCSLPKNWSKSSSWAMNGHAGASPSFWRTGRPLQSSVYILSLVPSTMFFSCYRSRGMSWGENDGSVRPDICNTRKFYPSQNTLYLSDTLSQGSISNTGRSPTYMARVEAFSGCHLRAASNRELRWVMSRRPK